MKDWRFWVRCMALALLAAGLLMPPRRTARDAYNLVAVLDITGSMNVRDQRLDGADASRLAMEKRSMRRLLASLPCGSRLGLAIFVEKQPFLLFEPVEICENFTALDEEIAAIDWRMGWDSESHIAETLLASMKMTKGLNADLLFMTDGQETPPLWWNAAPDFSAVRGSIKGLIAGVGATTFSPIPKFDGYGREIGVFKPGDVPVERDGMFRGREHLSALDEPHLRQLAATSGLAYVHLTGPEALLPALQQHATRRSEISLIDQSWLFACLALACLVACVLPTQWRLTRAATGGRSIAGTYAPAPQQRHSA
jgi:mxaL protein